MDNPSKTQTTNRKKNMQNTEKNANGAPNAETQGLNAPFTGNKNYLGQFTGFTAATSAHNKTAL